MPKKAVSSSAFILFGLGLGLLCPALGLAEENPLEVEVLVEAPAPRVAIDTPVSTVPTLATTLRYDPLVDLQERGTPESQGDVVIRGGTFENSALSLGALSVVDPQTGHYLLDLPMSSAFLTTPEILSGYEQSIRGLNASVGSVAYSFLPINQTEGRVRFGGGEWATDTESVLARQSDVGLDGLGVDIDYSRSRSGGTVRDGDSKFDTISGRVQFRGSAGQTDLFGGYQRKLTGWPDLYALEELHSLVKSSGSETDELRTGVVGLHHEYRFADDESFIRGGVLYRENRDDYELDRYQPGLFNPFKHKTQLLTGAIESAYHLGPFNIRSAARVLSDRLESTALTFLDYDRRVISQISFVPEAVFGISESIDGLVAAGVRYDDSDRSSASVLPVSRIQLTRRDGDINSERMFLDYSGASQLAGYTALASNPNAGLFRGNSELSQTISRNSELGVEIVREELAGKVSLIHRNDRDLVDWVYSADIEPFSPRSARNVDIETYGLESLIRWELDQLDLSGSYAYLHKNAVYGEGAVDASFYALNFPQHRVTFGSGWNLTERFRVQFDSELRIQEPNLLRRNGDRSYLLATLSAQWEVPELEDVTLELIVDNLGNENFEEVPGVPGRRRFVGAFMTWWW